MNHATQNAKLKSILARLPEPNETDGSVGQCEAVRLALTRLDMLGLLFQMDVDSAANVHFGEAELVPDTEGCALLDTIAARCMAVANAAHEIGARNHSQFDVFALYPDMADTEFAWLHHGRPEPFKPEDYEARYSENLLDRARSLVRDHPSALWIVWEVINHPVEVIAALEGAQLIELEQAVEDAREAVEEERDPTAATRLAIAERELQAFIDNL